MLRYHLTHVVAPLLTALLALAAGCFALEEFAEHSTNLHYQRCWGEPVQPTLKIYQARI